MWTNDVGRFGAGAPRCARLRAAPAAPSASMMAMYDKGVGALSSELPNFKQIHAVMLPRPAPPHATGEDFARECSVVAPRAR